MRFVFCLLLAACQGPSIISLGSEPLAVPESVEFGQTAISFSRVRQVVLTNRSRAPRSVQVQATPPFAAPEQVDVPGGADLTLALTFAPLQPGVVMGVVFIDGQEVQVSGEGVEVPDCGAPTVCDAARFDPETLACVREQRADGSPCEDELRCLEAGTCVAGTCVGRAARCDDTNPCTTDACAVGLGCQHAARECEAPANPCQAALCDPLTGCGSAPVQDGTPCGAVSCALANVCLAGACRAVVPPDGFTCAPASACRGEGVCRNKACQQPAAQDLLPKWRYTATESELRFEGISDAQGNWYWVECGYPPNSTARRCLAVSTTADGLERFRTELPTSTYRGVASRHTQLLAQNHFVFVVDEVLVAAVETSSGAVAWQRALLGPVTTGSRSVTDLAEDGRGVLWATVGIRVGQTRSVSLQRLELATGAARGETLLEGQSRGLLLDTLGRAYTVRSVPPTNGRYFLESFEVTGALRFSVMQSSTGLSLISGDVVVMTDDSARSTLDGREHSGGEGDVDPSQWVGVAQANGVRFRLGRSLTDFGPPTLRLSRVEPSGARSQLASVWADRGTELFLTAAGDTLLATSTNLETRARQVDPRGNELMSCSLVDDVSGTNKPVALGPVSAFNGRALALKPDNLSDCCEQCDYAERLDNVWGDCALIDRRELVFYELGRPGPGVATSGWVGPRGTPGGAQRAR